MSNKIYLNIYENDTRLKKYRLEEGEYSIGNNKKEADIYVDEECLENSFKIVCESKKKVYLNIINKNKHLLLNYSKISSSLEKIEIKHQDTITFKNSDKSIKFKFVETSRERSRSKEDKNKIVETKPEKEKEHSKSNSETQNKAYIKSEVIWNSVEFGDDKRKEKFLKLMGAKKKNQIETSSTKLDKSETEKLKQTFHKIDSDLTKQFYNAIGRKPPV